MKKSYFISIIFILILGVLALGAVVLYRPGSFFKKVPIQGYVFISKKNSSLFKGTVKERAGSKKEFFSASNEDWKKKHPLVGVEVRVLGKELKATTDEKGFFEIRDRKYNLKKDVLVIETRQHGRIIEYPLKSKTGLEHNFDKVLHIVNIKEDGHVEVMYLKEDDYPEKRATLPVLMVHGFGPDFGPFKIPLEKKKWNQPKGMFEKDQDLKGFDFFLFEYFDDQDIVQSSKELSWAIERLGRIYEQKIVLLAFSMGGLVCRHYLVSDWYNEGSIEKLLMVGTPNHGCDLALVHLDMDLEDGDGTASEEIMVDSDFLRALNNKAINSSQKQKYRINGQLQDYRGLNPEIDYAIIAGEVTRKIKEGFRETKKSFMGIIYDIFDFFDKIFSEVLGEGLDKDQLLWFFEDLTREAGKPLEEIINGLPPGDLIVTLESVTIEGVPLVTIPYIHGYLILPEY